ncbi:MAG: hypothetical protein ACXV5L_07475, partial [Thermoanaerobaculia bacterium]
QHVEIVIRFEEQTVASTEMPDDGIVREMTSSVIDRLGARLEFGIARQYEPTGIFEITRRAARKTPTAQMSLF